MSYFEELLNLNKGNAVEERAYENTEEQKERNNMEKCETKEVLETLKTLIREGDELQRDHRRNVIEPRKKRLKNGKRKLLIRHRKKTRYSRIGSYAYLYHFPRNVITKSIVTIET